MKIIAMRTVALPALLLPLVANVHASTNDEQTMVVTATPTAVSELDTPAAVSVVNGDDMRQAAPRINLSESLGAVPGLQVQNRQNYAQDLQLSIRGFGSRSTYGVRACGYTLTVSLLPCPMARGRHRISISAASIAWKCYADLFPRSMATLPAASLTSIPKPAASRRPSRPAATTAASVPGITD